MVWEAKRPLEEFHYWHDAYVAFKTRMFRDVVFGQFRHLNGAGPDDR